MQVGELTFDVFRSGQGLMLKVTQTKAGRAVQGLVTPEDLARLGHRFSPKPGTDNGMDFKLAEEIITRGYRSLSLLLHPDTGGSTEEMMKLNNVADQIREKLRR